MENDPSPTPARLPVILTIKAAFTTTLDHLPDLLRLGWLPAIAFLFTGLIFGISRDPHQFSPWRGLVASLLNLVIGAVWSVAWMRLVLGMPSLEVKLRLGRREWTYLKVMCIFMIGAVLSLAATMLLLIPAIPLLGSLGHSFRYQDHRVVLSLLFLTPTLVVTALFLRCLTAFPAIAIDRYKGLRVHFRQSRHNGWRVIAIAIALMAPGPALGFISYETSALAYHFSGAILGLLGVPLSAFSSSGYAQIYRALVPDSDESDSTVGKPVPAPSDPSP